MSNPTPIGPNPVLDKLVNKPVFTPGQRVVTNPSTSTAPVTGTIIGLASVHIIDMWIIMADEGQIIPNATYPFQAFTCPGTLIEPLTD